MSARIQSCLAAAVLLCAGCKSPKDCNVDAINERHPGELSVILRSNPNLTMDMLKVITDLEKEAGGYR